jgi:hypothetical protein
MNSNKNSSPKPNPSGEVKPVSGKLNLTPEQAAREARKLHEFCDDLENRPTPESSDARTSPLGRKT